jgi:hypothetical protein
MAVPRRQSSIEPPGRRHGAGARVMLALVAAGLIAMSTTSLVAARDPDWDQVANIKEAATRLAQIQRTQGASKAFTFIDACYRTHSLSSAYTKAFEACIAQDYMETQILTLIYSRMKPDDLKRMGAPSPAMLATTMSRRVGAAFGQYKIPPERIAEFKRTVDEHGFPLFFKTLFPDAKTPLPQISPQPSPQGGAPDPASPGDASPGNASPEKK